MNDVAFSSNTRLNISKTLPQLVLNERESQKNHTVLAQTIFSTNVDLQDLSRSQICAYF